MQKTISVDRLHEQTRELVADVAAHAAHYIIAENGEPAAALIPFGDLVRWQKAREREWDRLVTQLQGRLEEKDAAFDDGTVAAAVAEAVAGGLSENVATAMAAQARSRHFDLGGVDSVELLRQVREERDAQWPE